MSDSFVSLMYHNVCPTGWGTDAAYARLSPSITHYFLDDRTFAAHLGALCERADCLSYAEMAAFFDEPPSCTAVSAAGNPRLQLTFDDGWRDCVEFGGPLLEARGWQALLFVTTDFIGRPQFVTRDDLQHLPPHVFQIGSHTRTHRFLNELTSAEIRLELSESKAVLEDMTGRAVDAVSIPNGAVDRRVQAIAAEAGYRFVFTSNVHRNTPQTGPNDVGRLAVRRTTTLAQLTRVAEGRFGGEWLRRGLLGVPRTLLGPCAYRALRRRLLGGRDGGDEMVRLLQVPRIDVRPDGPRSHPGHESSEV